jgi:hypothetical protein
VVYWGLILTPKAFKTKKFEKWRKMRDDLFFNKLISITLESFLVMTISSQMTVFNPLYSTNGEATSMVLGYFCAGICLLFYPAISIYILAQKMDTIKSERFKAKWGNFYDQIKLRDTKYPLAYNVLFCTRRLIFVMIVVYDRDHPGIQIQRMIMMNFCYIIFYG